MTENEFLQKLAIRGFENQSTRTFLTWKGNIYRIKPDEAFYFKDKIILIEFESNKRLVESISKFWWLYKDTDWPKHEIEVELHFVILKSHRSEIRERSVQILGEELSKQVKNFNFFFYPYS